MFSIAVDLAYISLSNAIRFDLCTISRNRSRLLSPRFALLSISFGLYSIIRQFKASMGVEFYLFHFHPQKEIDKIYFTQAD